MPMAANRYLVDDVDVDVAIAFHELLGFKLADRWGLFEARADDA